jgi:hypothetical protein
MFADARMIPLPPVDWGGGVEKEVVLLELTTRKASQVLVLPIQALIRYAMP